jgi:NAD(P)-dependent dehydrogenase (short-subunit alcohol dehydrogenase family)
MPTVLVTGANRGLGLEFVRQYNRLGWRVIACSRSQSESLNELAAASTNISLHSVDVADHDSIDQLAAELGNQPIDILLNNAGIFGRVPFGAGGIGHQAFGASDFANWQQVMQVNLFGPMKMAETFVENVARSEQRKIVTLSSMVGAMGLNTIGGLYAYRTSKAAVNMLMHSMGIDLKPRGILAVAIHPGWARTEMGGSNAEIEAEDGVAGVIKVIAGLNEQSLGKLLSYTGKVMPY